MSTHDEPTEFWTDEPSDREEEDYGDDDDQIDFADPGGRSALRAETDQNPRNLPCPNCKRPNMLTPADRRAAYQCDICADTAEGRRLICPRCEKREALEQYSFGCYAGKLCDPCAFAGFVDHCGQRPKGQGTQAEIDEPIEAEYDDWD